MSLTQNSSAPVVGESEFAADFARIDKKQHPGLFFEMLAITLCFADIAPTLVEVAQGLL